MMKEPFVERYEVDSEFYVLFKALALMEGHFFSRAFRQEGVFRWGIVQIKISELLTEKVYDVVTIILENFKGFVVMEVHNCVKSKRNLARVTTYLQKHGINFTKTTLEETQ